MQFGGLRKRPWRGPGHYLNSDIYCFITPVISISFEFASALLKCHFIELNEIHREQYTFFYIT